MKSFGRPYFSGVVLLLILLTSQLNAQINAYFNSIAFNTPENQPYIETYLTISDKFLGSKKENGLDKQSVEVTYFLYQDSILVQKNQYNLHGPLYSGTLPPAFLDVHRYKTQNGDYTIQLILRDLNDLGKKPLTIKQPIRVDFKSGVLSMSGVEYLESIVKTVQVNSLSRNGYDMKPMPVDIFPETINDLNFYLELYNTNLVVDTGATMVFTYRIEHTESGANIETIGGFKKIKSAAVNPIVGRLSLKSLGTGPYNLVLELRDANNKIHLQERIRFFRINDALDIAVINKDAERKKLQEYFGSIQNADTLQMFVECLWPIANTVDKDRIINQAIRKDPEMMKKFVVDFWERRAADTTSPLKLWGEYYKRVQQVMVLFKCGKQKGYYTDRGRVYLQYGAPSQRAQQYNESNTYPYEIWHYYRTTDESNGEFYSNRKFVFVSRNMGDECFMLIHSDMRGEINNPRWRFQVSRSNPSGIDNPDNTAPRGTEQNQFNDIYTSPR